MPELNTYPCPSCGFLMFTEPPSSYEICSICGWEDDQVQLKHPELRGGANGGSLLDYQTAILKKVPADVLEYSGFQRHPEWRPLTEKDLIKDSIKSMTGLEYFYAAAEDSPPYYWQNSGT